MAKYALPEAITVTLQPVPDDIGVRIAGETITSSVGQKYHLLRRVLQKGDETEIPHNADGATINVPYVVRSIEPDKAYVGRRTLVVILGSLGIGTNKDGGFTKPNLHRDYSVPSHAHVGINIGAIKSEKTVVGYGGRAYSSRKGANREFRLGVRAQVAAWLEMVNTDIELFKEENWDASALIREKGRLEEILSTVY